MIATQQNQKFPSFSFPCGGGLGGGAAKYCKEIFLVLYGVRDEAELECPKETQGRSEEQTAPEARELLLGFFFKKVSSKGYNFPTDKT